MSIAVNSDPVAEGFANNATWRANNEAVMKIARALAAAASADLEKRQRAGQSYPPPPQVVLTQSSTTRTPQTAIVSGGGRTIIPIPVIGPNAFAVPTGTVSRATFATSTVTTAQLAQRVAALIQDLQAVGILPTST